MFTRALLPLLLAIHGLVPSPAESAEASAKTKVAGKKSKPRNSAPLAAYMPKMKAVLAAQWAAAIPARLNDFSRGNLLVTFRLDAAGAVADFTVTANTSNDAFAQFCEQLVRAAKFDPPPAGALTAGQVEIPFTFTIL